MMDMAYMGYMLDPMDFPEKPKPNLKTGEGHGHYRPLTRERPMKGIYGHKRKKAKMAKKSKRRNRA